MRESRCGCSRGAGVIMAWRKWLILLVSAAVVTVTPVGLTGTRATNTLPSPLDVQNVARSAAWRSFDAFVTEETLSIVSVDD